MERSDWMKNVRNLEFFFYRILIIPVNREEQLLKMMLEGRVLVCLWVACMSNGR